jgi:pyruvate,orthophosphate dikinase
MTEKYVYSFGSGTAEGRADLKDLLGGKGANLAEMARMGIPVPPGFTIITDACNHYLKNEKVLPEGLEEQVEGALERLEHTSGLKFGDRENPLLVSVRSGSRVSMPGMMDTILDLGLNEDSVADWRRDEQPALRVGQLPTPDQDAQQRRDGVPDAVLNNVENQLKRERGVQLDSETAVEDLPLLTRCSVRRSRSSAARTFPWSHGRSCGAPSRRCSTRGIPPRNRVPRDERDSHDLGTAVTIQMMVFGNMGEDCGSGVASRAILHRRQGADRRVPVQRAGRGHRGGTAPPNPWPR